MRSWSKQRVLIGMISMFNMAVCCLCAGGLHAAEWLAPGIHELTTSREAITCTLVVPAAVAEGKPLPLLMVLAPDGLPEAKPWQEWSDRRGCAVVTIKGYRAGIIPIGKEGMWPSVVSQAATIHAAVLTAVKAAVPVHPFLRFITGTRGCFNQVVAMTQQDQEDFGGMLVVMPAIDASAVGQLRPDVPVVLVIDADNEATLTTAGTVGDRLRTDGGILKVATVDDLAGAEPSFDVHTRAMDWLLNIARATHKRFSPKERKGNLEEIAGQAQELPGLVDPAARRECAGFLMSVPGIEKMKRDYERLADVWVESAVEITRLRAAKEPVEAHEFLSVVVKKQRFQEASGKQQKAAQTELTRLRKDPLVRKEIAAYDLVADTCAMLDHDESLAKQRIALKDLQAVIDQYPKTHAAKTAAKLVARLQQNLR
jgi:hypothetical protein